MFFDAILANSELITQVFVMLIQALAIVAIYYGKKLYDRYQKYLDINTTKQQQEILRVAAESILLFVERTYTEMGFEEKIDEIIARVDQRLTALGLTLDVQTIKDTVLETWQEQQRDAEEIEVMKQFIVASTHHQQAINPQQ